MSAQNKNEQVGGHFSLEKLLAARTKTRTAVEMIAKVIKPGMSEEAAHIEAANILKYIASPRSPGSF